MSNLEIIEYIEDKDAKINDNWYYHASTFSENKYKKILKEGLLSPSLNKERISSYNYIFVSKATEEEYSFFNYYSIHPNFIISEKIKAISVSDGFIQKLIKNGYHGLKFTSLFEEYQVYKKIDLKNIVGILFNLEKNINNYPNKKDYYLKVLYELSLLLNKNTIDLPIIDYYTSKEINKEKVLKLEKIYNLRG